jgi:hypothetical protein
LSTPDASVERYIAAAPKVQIDVDTLAQLSRFLATGKATMLLGFNDYAKHLINLHTDTVVGVMDFRKSHQGITYRQKAVAPVGWQECEQFVVCDYSSLFAYKRAIYARCAKERKAFLFAGHYNKQQTKVVEFIHQDPLYQGIFDTTPRPATMLAESGLFNTLELLRSTLMLPGDVAEVRAWQGGSAWHIARMLHLTGSTKGLFTFDMGETMPATNPQGIVCEDQMRADLGFYPHTQCFFGPATASLPQLDNRTFSFVFIDFGFVENILDFFWSGMTPGAVLLMDNYGHTLGHPDLFDAFLEARGSTAVRTYKQPDSFAIKH